MGSKRQPAGRKMAGGTGVFKLIPAKKDSHCEVRIFFYIQ